MYGSNYTSQEQDALRMLVLTKKLKGAQGCARSRTWNLKKPTPPGTRSRNDTRCISRGRSMRPRTNWDRSTFAIRNTTAPSNEARLADSEMGWSLKKKILLSPHRNCNLQHESWLLIGGPDRVFVSPNPSRSPQNRTFGPRREAIGPPGRVIFSGWRISYSNSESMPTIVRYGG
jgi:hypothetical protein